MKKKKNRYGSDTWAKILDDHQQGLKRLDYHQ